MSTFYKMFTTKLDHLFPAISKHVTNCLNFQISQSFQQYRIISYTSNNCPVYPIFDTN